MGGFKMTYRRDVLVPYMKERDARYTCHECDGEITGQALRLERSVCGDCQEWLDGNKGDE